MEKKVRATLIEHGADIILSNMHVRWCNTGDKYIWYGRDGWTLSAVMSVPRISDYGEPPNAETETTSEADFFNRCIVGRNPLAKHENNGVCTTDWSGDPVSGDKLKQIVMDVILKEQLWAKRYSQKLS